MKRQIIKIDEDKCNGCGACVTACHEGAIGLVEGKAKLLRDDYCDGLGDCLPSCPTGAITFEQREAKAYDEAAVKANMKKKAAEQEKLPCGCPSTQSKAIKREPCGCPSTQTKKIMHAPGSDVAAEPSLSQLSQWPVQIKLVPVNAPYFDGAKLLIAADCTAYAYGGFHNRFIKDHVTLIGCPKLDMGDYAEKLTEIIRANNIKSVKVVRMEVPCCGGIENAVKQAIMSSGKMIPWGVYTVTTDGQILE